MPHLGHKMSRSNLGRWSGGLDTLIDRRNILRVSHDMLRLGHNLLHVCPDYSRSRACRSAVLGKSLQEQRIARIAGRCTLRHSSGRNHHYEHTVCRQGGMSGIYRGRRGAGSRSPGRRGSRCNAPALEGEAGSSCGHRGTHSERLRQHSNHLLPHFA